MRTMPEIDKRSLALHRLIVEKIRNDPALFEKVIKTLVRWRKIVDRSSQPYLLEWQQLVDQGIEASLAMASEDTEQATTLRKSSPFIGILTEPERLDFLRTWNKDRS